MANKTRIEFEGFEEVIAKLTKLNADVPKVTERALKETHKTITNKVEESIRSHKKTGQTEKSLVRQAKVEWSGTIASVETGFDISHGGLPSIFLMYGTPRMQKDQKLYNAFFGKKIKDEINKIQEDIFYDEIRRLNS